MTMKSLMNIILMVIVSLLLVQARKEVKLPEYFQFCKRDNHINKCLKSVLEDLIPKLSNGLPEVGMESIDPLLLEELAVDYQDNQVFLKYLLRNLRTFGLCQSSITKVRSKLSNETLQMEIDIAAPQFVVESNFIGDIRLNALVFKSKGYINVTLVDLVATMKLYGEVEKIRGEDHIRIKEIQMKPILQDLKIYVTDVVAGNPEISTFARTALNQNWKEVYKHLLPIAENYWNVALVRQINKIFLKVPYHILFPYE